MLFVIVWIVVVGAVFALGYSYGYQAGHLDGSYRGFQGAIRRAIQVEKPLNLLQRVLVPKKDG